MELQLLTLEVLSKIPPTERTLQCQSNFLYYQCHDEFKPGIFWSYRMLQAIPMPSNKYVADALVINQSVHS